MPKHFLEIIALIIIWLIPASAFSQWCCSYKGNSTSFLLLEPDLALRRSLQVGIYYEYYHLNKLLGGSHRIADLSRSQATVRLVSLTLEAGLSNRISVGVIAPYLLSERSFFYRPAVDVEKFARLEEKGWGDITILGKVAIFPYSSFGQLSGGLGLQIPTKSSTSQALELGTLDLQPSSGSVSFLSLLSYYVRYRQLGLFASSSAKIPTVDQDGFKNGNVYSLLLGGNWFLSSHLGLTLQSKGKLQTKDYAFYGPVYSSGSKLVDLIMGVNFKPLLAGPALQFLYFLPLYQQVEGFQLGVTRGLTLNSLYSIPL